MAVVMHMRLYAVTVFLFLANNHITSLARNVVNHSQWYLYNLRCTVHSQFLIVIQNAIPPGTKYIPDDHYCFLIGLLKLILNNVLFQTMYVHQYFI